MSERTRYALYYTPAPGSALAAFGQEILGDILGDSLVDSRLPDWSEADRDALAAITAEPRVYGFHATLKAPMRLAPDAGEQDLLAACLALAAHRRPIPVGRLGLRPIGDFLALVPEEPCPALGLFAAECVAALDPLRAPLTAAERARRRPERLDARRRALLDRWGYPHVFEAFRFHMTLTGRLSPEQRDAWFARLSQVCPEIDLAIDAITLLHQIGDGPFRVLRRLPFES